MRDRVPVRRRIRAAGRGDTRADRAEVRSIAWRSTVPFRALRRDPVPGKVAARARTARGLRMDQAIHRSKRSAEPAAGTGAGTGKAGAADDAEIADGFDRGGDPGGRRPADARRLSDRLRATARL